MGGISFCGPGEDLSTLPVTGFLTECQADLVGLIPQIFILLVVVPNMIFKWLKLRSPCDATNAKSLLQFPGHNVRWVLTIALAIVMLFEIAEAGLSDTIDKGPHVHLHLVNSFALVAVILTIVFYNFVEMYNLPRFLFLLFLYWSCVLIVKVVKIVSLTKKGIGFDYLRLDLVLVDLILSVLLWTVDLYLLYTQKYMCKNSRPITVPTEEAHNITYRHPYTNFLSHLTWQWLSSLLAIGYRRPIEMNDLGNIPESEHARENFKKFREIFEEERKKAARKNKQPSLWRVYFLSFWPLWLVGGACKLSADMLGFVGPMCVDGIVSYITAEADIRVDQHSNVTVTAPEEQQYVTVREFSKNGYALTVVAFLAYLLQATCWQNHFFLCVRQGIRAKGAIQAMVFVKTLKLSTWSMNEGGMNQGQIVNHMSVDPIHILWAFYLGHFVWTIPIQVLLTFILLYKQLGISAVLSASIILLMCPVQYFIGAKLAHVQKNILENSDERMKKANEVLQSIKLLKLYAWECIFQKSVQKIRQKELKQLLYAAMLRTVSNFFTEAGPLGALLITFVIYPQIEHKTPSTGKVFSGLALFSMLGIPLLVVTMIINIISHAKVSTARLLPFFLAPEVEESGHNTPKSNDLVQMPSVEIKDAKTTKGAVTVTPESLEGNDGEVAVNHVSVDTPFIQENQKEAGENKTGGEVAVNHVSVDTPLMQENQKEAGENKTGGSCRDSDVAGVENSNEKAPNAIQLEDASFAWDLNGEDPVLHDISLSVPQGKLTMIVGAVGSGKSSLLLAMLGEMTTVRGSITWVKGSKVAYAAQKPWLMNASMKSNILFGQEEDTVRYQKVLEVCALKPDIEILPAGDLTEIGEKGINMSGGQKQRVSVGRAMYSQSDVIILDDPLSALDVHVGSHIFKEGIVDFLLKNKKTVVLVTHQLQYLTKADKVVVMSGGRITHQGSMQQIKQDDPGIYDLWKNTIQQARVKLEHTMALNNGTQKLPELKRIEPERQTVSRKEGHEMASLMLPATPRKTRSLWKKTERTEFFFQIEQEGDEVSLSAAKPLHQPPLGATSVASMMSLSQVSLFDEQVSAAKSVGSTHTAEDMDEEEIKKNETGKLVEEEEREQGSVALRVYVRYAQAATVYMTLITLLLYIGRQVVRMGADYWLALWSEAAQKAERLASAQTPADNSTASYSAYTLDSQDEGYDMYYYVRGCILLYSSGMVMAFLTIGTLEYTCLIAAKHLHQQMLQKIITAPLRFFDTTPIGRILNRFAADTNTIDEKIPVTLDGVIYCVLFVVGGIVLNTVSTPYFLIAAVPMFFVYLAIQRYYISSSRELQRLESISKSPVLAHFSETLGGLATIRAYKDQQRFKETSMCNIDKNNTAFLYLHTANVWMGIRLDYLGAFIVFMAAVSSLTSGLYGVASPGLVGISIAYALMISFFLNWTMRNISEGEMWFNAVERVSHYTNITPEPYHQTREIVPDESWPEYGEIQFDNLSLTYDASLDPVIKNLDLHVKGGEKVGICGRTGSGKSSMMLGLFRIINISDGHILIDDIDISLVPLHTLRSRLSIIPQDPVLFEGTVRFNLDPESKESDDDIWKALEIAQLKPVIQGLPGCLGATVTEGGENFSVGQRQLFCLARAFLRNSKVLIMDEATASIDMATDAVIQEVIKTAFKDRTVLTIAHRVATILNCDKILVLSEGRIVEHDSPQNLMSFNSIFASMVKEDK